MISPEQVQDLQPGDVVEVRHADWPEGAVVSGPLHADHGDLWCGPMLVRRTSGLPSSDPLRTLTVVSPAKPPLYVNHPRTEPVPGDVVNYVGWHGDVVGPFLYTHAEKWAGSHPGGRLTRWVGLPGLHPDAGPIYNAGNLRLLVDGSTGQVVSGE